MKNKQSTHPSAFAMLIKSISNIISSFFQSSNGKEFKRLKDFIAS